MINEEFMQILREYGSVTIEYSPPVEESHLGSWGESVLFIIRDGEHSWILNSGAHVMDGTEWEEETLDRLAERLVESRKRKIEFEKQRAAVAKAEEEEWDVHASWLSE